MNDGLVTGLDGGGVRQDGDVGVELPAGAGLAPFVQQYHALPHLISLYLLQSQRCRLPRHHLCGPSPENSPISVQAAENW